MFSFSLLAIIIFSYLLFLHYADTESFCDFAPELSCDIVNKSIYSEFPPGSGIPVSFLGIVTFMIVVVSLFSIKTNKELKLNSFLLNKKSFSTFLFYLMLLSLLFALYLLYTELVFILSICILCVAADLIIIVMLILSYQLKVICHEKR